MNSTIKISLFSVLLFCSFASKGQSNDHFSLSFSMFNHAGLLSEGTTAYILKNDSITIKRWQGKTEKVLFSKEIDPKTIAEIQQLGLDSLGDYYFNNCIVPTSGNEYTVSIKDGATSKKIHLHHYYLKQIAQLVVFINNQVPESYQIHYQTEKTKQDCE